MKSKLDLALRRNRGKQILPDWIRNLTEACEYQVLAKHFLTPDDTRALKDRFLSRLANGSDVLRRNLSTDIPGELERRCRHLSIALGSQPTVLFSSVDEVVGAVRLPANVVLRNFGRVWKVVEEDFRLASANIEDGLCIELNYYDLAGRYIQARVYELAAWGHFSQESLCRGL